MSQFVMNIATAISTFFALFIAPAPTTPTVVDDQLPIRVTEQTVRSVPMGWPLNVAGTGSNEKPAHAATVSVPEKGSVDAFTVTPLSGAAPLTVRISDQHEERDPNAKYTLHVQDGATTYRGGMIVESCIGDTCPVPYMGWTFMHAGAYTIELYRMTGMKVNCTDNCYDSESLGKATVRVTGESSTPFIRLWATESRLPGDLDARLDTIDVLPEIHNAPSGSTYSVSILDARTSAELGQIAKKRSIQERLIWRGGYYSPGPTLSSELAGNVRIPGTYILRATLFSPSGESLATGESNIVTILAP